MTLAIAPSTVLGLRTPWQLPPLAVVPDWFLKTVQSYVDSSGAIAAQLLWQRGIRTAEHLNQFLSADQYVPTSPFAFGAEMEQAVTRIQQASDRQERVAIWGDFDADGITATAVLWEGLQPFFPHPDQLHYTIPNRLTESHGLHQRGLAALAAEGITLVITCDTGSTNLEELRYAQELGLDVIVTDHHTLPSDRPPVVAIINPRSLPSDHALATLSGVAVAYKLIEALYERYPAVDHLPLAQLRDLVAIGLIADLVELRGDCRYLAQKGIEQLQRQTQGTPHRPGVAMVLDYCKRSGDRPTDISFGIGPRINAISRVHGDARFCVELLTSRDRDRCRFLAEQTELANVRRKALQRDVADEVRLRLAQVDLSTTHVIVLEDSQWSVGVLGLVAGQIAREFGRPTILLSSDALSEEGLGSNALMGDALRDEARHGEMSGDALESGRENALVGAANPSVLARGSARSPHQQDLYELLYQQRHLLHRFGGHPLAAGLSLPVENIPLFADAINRDYRQRYGADLPPAVVSADVEVTVAQLGPALFRELKLLEPCGMGNPVPKLLIQNCWFEKARHKNLRDRRGQQVRYIKTSFELWDESSATGFPGVWWEHYSHEVPKGRCDVVVELDFNPSDQNSSFQPRYEVRLLAVRPHQDHALTTGRPTVDWILDWRSQPAPRDETPLVMEDCPSRWNDFYPWFQQAQQQQCPLAIAYRPPDPLVPSQVWRQLVGMAKYLSRTGRTAHPGQLLEKLALSDRLLPLALTALETVGFQVQSTDEGLKINYQSRVVDNTEAIAQFLAAVQEERFRQRYFYEVPLTTIQTMAQTSLLLDLNLDLNLDEEQRSPSLETPTLP